jgi:hypothetical protein
MSEDHDDPWLVAEAENEGSPVIYRIREGIPPGVQAVQYPYLLSILWRYEQVASGMPSEEDDELMRDFEEATDQLEKLRLGYLTVVVTGAGEKEWFWYVSDFSDFTNHFNESLAALPVLPLQFEVSEDPEWKSYFAFISSVRSD